MQRREFIKGSMWTAAGLSMPAFWGCTTARSCEYAGELTPGGTFEQDIAAKVLEPLGADCSGSQFLEPDGSFPTCPSPNVPIVRMSIC